MKDVPDIFTERLRLRRRVPDDAQALYPSMSDSELMTWWSRAPFTSLAELRAYLEADTGNWRIWSITHRGDDRAIGFVAAGEKRQGGVSEIGYLLERACWGSGLAREAVTGLIDQLFREGQRRVAADTDPDNVASNALLERLGFQREGYLRDEWQTHIGVRDTVLWGLLAREWTRTESETLPGCPPPECSSLPGL